MFATIYYVLLHLQVLTETTPKTENFTDDPADNILPPNTSKYLRMCQTLLISDNTCMLF